MSTGSGPEARFPIQGNANFGIQFNGEAKGSQTVLLVFSFLAFLLLSGGIAILSLSSQLNGHSWVAGILSIALGIGVFFTTYKMWLTSQPSIDEGHERSRQGNIAVSPSGILVSGAEKLVFAEDTTSLVVTLTERVFTQRPLPPPSGVINGSASDANAIRELAPSDAEALYQKQLQALQQSRDELIRKLSSLQINSQIALAANSSVEDAVVHKEVTDGAMQFAEGK